jgi:hypothetical protein
MTKRMQTVGQKQASAEFFNTIGWLQPLEKVATPFNGPHIPTIDEQGFN